MPSEGEKSRSNSAPARLVSADASKIGASMDFFNAAKVGFFIVIIYRLCATVFFVNFKLCFKIFKIRIKKLYNQVKKLFPYSFSRRADILLKGGVFAPTILNGK